MMIFLMILIVLTVVYVTLTGVVSMVNYTKSEIIGIIIEGWYLMGIINIDCDVDDVKRKISEFYKKYPILFETLIYLFYIPFVTFSAIGYLCWKIKMFFHKMLLMKKTSKE